MTKKLPILMKENIVTNCESVSRQEAVIAVGQLLVNSGYVTERYVAGMLDRDEKLSVYIGNMLAIPHGEYEVKNEILNSGIALMVYPDGIDWGGEEVKIVMGIAGIGDEHLKILSNTAIIFSEIETVNKVIELFNQEEIYELLTTEYV